MVPLLRCCYSSSITLLAVFLKSLSVRFPSQAVLKLLYNAAPVIGCMFQFLGRACIALNDERERAFIHRNNNFRQVSGHTEPKIN